MHIAEIWPYPVKSMAGGQPSEPLSVVAEDVWVAAPDLVRLRTTFGCNGNPIGGVLADRRHLSSDAEESVLPP